VGEEMRVVRERYWTKQHLREPAEEEADV
jgi:hypothetical protein